MAKVRVYELAKELNLDSKNLVEKLKTGGMDITNYMSTLDDQAVVEARDIVSGVISEVVEEQRIRPTVIRRRKKTIRLEPKKPAPKSDDEAEKVEGEPEISKGSPEKMAKAAEPVPQEVEKEIKEEVIEDAKTTKPQGGAKPKEKVKKVK